jgi:hypothetical protein
MTCFPAAATAASGAEAGAGAAMTAGRARRTAKKVFIVSVVDVIDNKVKCGRELFVCVKRGEVIESLMVSG